MKFISEYAASAHSEENLKRKKAIRKAKRARYLERKRRIKEGNKRAAKMQSNI